MDVRFLHLRRFGGARLNQDIESHRWPCITIYQVAPQFKRIAGSIDFTVIYLIAQGEKFPFCLSRLSPMLHMILTLRAREQTTRCARGLSTSLQEVSLALWIFLRAALSPRCVSSLIPSLLSTLCPKRDRSLISWNRRTKQD
jgi:hypothetical protein